MRRVRKSGERTWAKAFKGQIHRYGTIDKPRPENRKRTVAMNRAKKARQIARGN